MAGPAQENKVNAPQSSEGERETSGLSMAPPAFSLTAGSGAGQGAIQRQEAPNTSVTPHIWQGLINTAQVGFHKEPRAATNDATDYIRPDLELSELVLVQEELQSGWLKVARTQVGGDIIGYVDKRFVNRMPGQIGHSRHRVGRNDADTATHHDLMSGDETKETIDDINSLFWIQTNQSDETLFALMRAMCTEDFSMGDLETNILAMIDHFQANTGTNYSNPILTQAVSEHDSTKRFLANVEAEFAKKMAETNGDASHLNSESLAQLGNPHFDTWTDTISGLQIAINDVWAYDLDLQSYDRSGDQYKAILQVNLHDHFGLDRPDAEKKFGYLAGFRAWYVLQHLRGYKPFIVDIPISHTFTGTVRRP